MRWLADECVDARIVALLRSDGHDVVHVLETAPSTNDRDILVLAQQQIRLLLTEDKDFGDIAIRQAIAVPGIVHLRIEPDSLSLKCAQLQIAIVTFGETLFGRYTVVEGARFRYRDLPSI